MPSAIVVGQDGILRGGCQPKPDRLGAPFGPGPQVALQANLPHMRGAVAGVQAETLISRQAIRRRPRYAISERRWQRMGRGLLALLIVAPGLTAQDSPGSCDLVRSLSLTQRAQTASSQRLYETAVNDLLEAWKACPSQRTILLDLSHAYSEKRDFQQAIQTAQRFLETEPASVPGRLALANAYFMARQFAAARQQAERSLQLEPGQPAALKIKANAAYLLGDFDQAVDTFIELLDRHPNDEDAAYMLGRIYYQEGRIDHAVGQFQRVLRINPNSYKAHDNLGLCYQARGDSETAIRHFLAAIKLVEKDHPDYDWPYANLASLLLDNGDDEKAFAAASKAADRNPHSARNFYLGGKALLRLQKIDLSVNWLERSIALDPNYPEPLYLLAKVYKQLGKDDKAKQVLEKFREVKARTPQNRR